MTDYIEIHWTSGSLDEARKICRYLAQQRWIACAQIIPWVESIFIWNKQLETAQESKILLKAKKEHYLKIKEIIETNCSYQIPEITYTQIDGGNELYLEWMKETIVPSEESVV